VTRDTMADAEKKANKQAAKMGNSRQAVLVLGAGAGADAEYERLVKQATELVNAPPLDFLSTKEKKEFVEKNLKKAENQCRRAVELFPSKADAHYTLGCAQSASGQTKAAAASFTAVTAFEEEGSVLWADAATHAYAMLAACADAPRPEWWTDEQLLAISERAVAMLPESPHAQLMRADALSSFEIVDHGLPERTVTRTGEHLRTASAHYQAAAKIALSKEEKRAAVYASAECLVHAKRVDALVAASAATASAGGSGGGGFGALAAGLVAMDAAADGEEEGRQQGGEGAASGAASGKNAAKNRKKKEKQKQKLAEQLLQEVEGDAAVRKPIPGTAAASGTTQPYYDVSRGLPLADFGIDVPLPPAPPRAVYRWANPLPESCSKALSEMGVEAGGVVSAVDLVGIEAEGGPEEAVAAGLIVRGWL